MSATSTMTMVNVMPHEVTIAGIVLPPSGQVARIEDITASLAPLSVDGATVPVTGITPGNLAGLPDPRPGVVYVASRAAAEAAGTAGRTDVYAPYGVIRDVDGNPDRAAGAAGLARPAGRRLVVDLGEEDWATVERMGADRLVLGWTLGDLEVMLAPVAVSGPRWDPEAGRH